MATETHPLRILIADDHALFRDGLRYVLKQLDENVEIFEAGDGEQALTAIEAHPELDLLLLDLAMGASDGMDVMRRLKEHGPSVPIVIVSASDDPAVVQTTMEHGAQGYIPKSSTATVMLSALRLILAGGIYVPPIMLDDPRALAHTSSHIAATGGSTARSTASREHGLTVRQLEVLSLLCKGLSNKEICQALDLSEGTVKIHVTAILRALDVENRTQALLVAQQRGLIERPDPR